MLITKVKASSVAHLTDARYFAAWEVHWLGFNLDTGQDAYLDPRQVAAIREWVDGPRVCGEFGLADAAAITALADELSLDAIQLHMLAPLELLPALAGLRPLLQEVVVESYVDPDSLLEWMETREPYVEAFVVNFSKGGIAWADLESGHPFGLDVLRDWCERLPILLEIDMADTPPTVALHALPVYGFSVRGGAEEKVGYKNFEELDAWFEALEGA